MGFLKKDLETDLRKLVNQEFLTQKSSGGIIFTKNYNDRINNISFSFTGYPNMYKVSPPVVSIQFIKVESIIKEALYFLNLDDHIVGSTIKKVCLDIPNVNYEVFDIFMKEQSDFDLVRDDIQKALVLGAYPFFDKFDSLEKLSKLIDLNNLPDNIHIFIPQLTPIKLLLIKIISNDKDWEDYFKLQKDWYHSEVYKYPQHFKDHDKLFDYIFYKILNINL